MSGSYVVIAMANGCSSVPDTIMVTVNAVVRAVISGKIETEIGQGVQLTTVTATGSPVFTDITDTSGKYSFNLIQGSNYTVSPKKNNDSIVTNGVTTLDFLLIQRHILGTALLNTPYKIIAADVNSSETVTSLDLLYIRQLILGDITSFPGGKLWVFVPASHAFSNPLNPFPFPTSLSYPSVSQQSNQNFIGIKLGCVNDSWNPNTRSLQTTDTVTLITGEMSASPGTIIRVPVRAKNFKRISGIQFTVQWDATMLSFSSVDNDGGALTVNDGETKITEGMLSVQWTDPDYGATTLGDNSILFYINYKVIGSVGQTSAVAVTPAMAIIEVVDSDLNLLPYSLNNGSVRIETATEIGEMKGIEAPEISVIPNPFGENTNLNFTLNNETGIKIEVYNELGQLTESHEGHFEAGRHHLEMGNNWSAGVYFIKFTADGYTDVLRVVAAGK
jgi:hypothetical protein